MPIPHPNFTAVLRGLPTTRRIAYRRRLNRLAARRLAWLDERHGPTEATERARLTLIAYAGETRLSPLGQVRHAVANSIWAGLRARWDKPQGLTGYERRGD